MKKIVVSLFPIVLISCTTTEKLPKLENKTIVNSYTKYENGKIVVDSNVDYSKILELREILPVTNEYVYMKDLKLLDTGIIKLNIDIDNAKASVLNIENLTKDASIYIDFNFLSKNNVKNKDIVLIRVKDNGKYIKARLKNEILLDDTELVLKTRKVNGYIEYYLKPIFLSEKKFKEVRNGE